MADGSVIIGVSLDTTMFYRSIELIESRINGLGGSMSTSLSSAFSGEQLFASVDNAFRRISSSAMIHFGEVYGTISAAADNSTSYFSSAPWSESGAAAAAGIASGMTLGFPLISSAVSALLSKISLEFSSGWKAIGQNISSGIAEGILSAAPTVTDAAKKVAVDTSDTIKGHYRISSPSALMRDEVGVMISRGIAEGITSGASFIGNALSSVYGATGSAYRASPADSGRSGSLTQNIYLRDSDFSPYRTAKRIRRESEAIFGI